MLGFKQTRKEGRKERVRVRLSSLMGCGGGKPEQKWCGGALLSCT